MTTVCLKRLKVPLGMITCGLLLANGSALSLFAGDDDSANGYPTSNGYRMQKIERRQQNNNCYQGFGLNWHLGYGYGGKAAGVGQDGGYPYYGGIGYPGPMPRLRRLCGINPFPYNGNPGGPTAACPHYYGIPGPLSPTEHVITFEADPHVPPYSAEYGIFTGTIPYPESAFVPGSVSSVPDALPSPTESPVENKEDDTQKKN